MGTTCQPPWLPCLRVPCHHRLHTARARQLWAAAGRAPPPPCHQAGPLAPTAWHPPPDQTPPPLSLFPRHHPQAPLSSLSESRAQPWQSLGLRTASPRHRSPSPSRRSAAMLPRHGHAASTGQTIGAVPEPAGCLAICRPWHASHHPRAPAEPPPGAVVILALSSCIAGEANLH
jgi:hypothetical protein